MMLPTVILRNGKNEWCDLDNSGSGNRDSIWMPIAQDMDLQGDFIDNDLDGIADQKKQLSPTEWEPLFESAPFVYHGLGIPDPETTLMSGDGRDNDGLDDDGNPLTTDDVVDNGTENRYFLTVPLPGMVMQIDLNSDGVYDERDYCYSGSYYGPVYAQIAG